MLKLFMIRWSDGTGYFAAVEETKIGGYKGLQVNRWNNKRKPDKATQAFIRFADITKCSLGWVEILASIVPNDVDKRFAERGLVIDSRGVTR